MSLDATRLAGRPRKGSGEGGYTQALVRALGRRPGMPIRDLARVVYGDASTPNRDRVRSLLVALKRFGRAVPLGRGFWVIADVPRIRGGA